VVVEVLDAAAVAIDAAAAGFTLKPRPAVQKEMT
jgi:hypothetical protein